MTGWEGEAVSVLCEKVTVPIAKKSEISKANTAHGCKPWLRLRASTLECQKLWVSVRRGINLSCSTPPQHGSTPSPFLCPIKSENGENSSFQVFSKEKMAEKQSVREVKGGSSEFVSDAADVLFCYVPSGPALSLWGKVADFTGGCGHWELKPWIYMPVLQELTVCFSLKLQVTQAEAPQANGRANSFI